MAVSNKFYVKQGSDFVGEAVVIGETIYVHMYKSYLSIQWKVGKVPKLYKLEPRVN